MSTEPTDWRLRLKYGQTTTNFQHFVVIADGEVGELTGGFECAKGRAFMTMAVWATDCNEAIDMIRAIGRSIGFSVDGEVRVYVAEPQVPPEGKPLGYAIRFTPYDEDA